MAHPYPLEQSGLEKAEPRALENKAALESKIDQAGPAGDKAAAAPDKTATDAEQIKAELPDKQYDAKSEAGARIESADKQIATAYENSSVQVNETKINELLNNDPEKTTAAEGKDHHLTIQKDLTQKGEYDRFEVKATNEQGQEAKRVREITKGKNIGEIREEGTVYDLYTETDSTIYTGEIKPFSPTGIKEAELKLEKQVDIEQNYGGDHGGKVVEREIVFYDPRDSSIVLRGPAETTLQKARDLAQNW